MQVLSEKDWAFWEENGYVVIPNAVPQENLDALIEQIWTFLEMEEAIGSPGTSTSPIRVRISARQSRRRAWWRCTSTRLCGTTASIRASIRHSARSWARRNCGYHWIASI